MVLEVPKKTGELIGGIGLVVGAIIGIILIVVFANKRHKNRLTTGSEGGDLGDSGGFQDGATSSENI